MRHSWATAVFKTKGQRMCLIPGVSKWYAYDSRIVLFQSLQIFLLIQVRFSMFRRKSRLPSEGSFMNSLWTSTDMSSCLSASSGFMNSFRFCIKAQETESHLLICSRNLKRTLVKPFLESCWGMWGSLDELHFGLTPLASNFNFTPSLGRPMSYVARLQHIDLLLVCFDLRH